MANPWVRITRDSQEVGKPGRVYVIDCRYLCADPPAFSSTRNAREASLFTREEAKQLIATRSWRNARIE